MERDSKNTHTHTYAHTHTHNHPHAHTPVLANALMEKTVEYVR